MPSGTASGTRAYPADIALEALGYTAAGIPAGKVVGNDIMKALPYGYDPASGLGFKIDTVLLAGLQILAGLEFSVSVAEYTDEMAMQPCGLTFEYDSSKDPMDPMQLVYQHVQRRHGVGPGRPVLDQGQRSTPQFRGASTGWP